MPTKTRFDYVELKVRKTDEGFIYDMPNVARTGILEYRNDDGSIRRELRLPEDVFHADSLASFVGKPITVDHPKGMVNNENIGQYHVGTMLSAGKQDGDNVKTEIVIHQPKKIGDRRQLSLGYNVDLEETPGEWQGQKYDAIQRNIRVNHLSVVKSARAGAQARLNLDSNEEPLITELVEMPKVRLDNGIEYEAAPEVIVQLNKLNTDATAHAEVIKTHTTALTALQTEKDKLQARVDAFPAELAKATDAAKAALQARSDLEKTATAFKIDSKDKTDEQLQHAIIKSYNKDANLEGKSADYVAAMLDMAIASRKDAAMQQQRQIVNGSGGDNRTDAGETDAYRTYMNSIGANATVKAKE